jgi:multicomponent Na+:H+ antiporter subunit E
MTKSTQTIKPHITPKYRVVISLFTSLLIVWLMLNSTLAWQVWALGAVLAFAGAILLKDIATAYAGISITPRTIFYYFAYLGLFLKELVKSNLYVARLVLMPDPDLQPAIIQVKTTLKSAIGRLALANSITLTPGTLVVDIRDDSLFIHCINVSKTHPAEGVAESVRRFEKYLEVVYG